MGEVNFEYGAIIRAGPKFDNGGKWDAFLDEYVRNAVTNADLTIYIRLYLDKIDPAGDTGLYGDADDEPATATTPAVVSKKKIQKWKPGEFENYGKNLVKGAQRFWNGVFWLKTPKTYNKLNTPDAKPTHRCNLYCKFELEQVFNANDAHYTIAVVRAQDGQNFRSHSRLFSQNDIKSEHMIPHSTAKFWTHYHEVGHLIGLGHVGTGGVTNVHNDNSDTAYGVTKHEMMDVMGRGTVKHDWHARPWQEAAETFTGVKADDWKVYRYHIYPERI